MIPCERDRIALSWSLRAGIVFFGLLCSAAPGKAQARGAFRADRMDTVLYGVAYYPEYMPYDRLDQDVQLMQKAGITVVRIGEFSWGLWEPEDGKFEFAWIDRVVDKRSEEHTSELQSQSNLVCRLLLEKKNNFFPAAHVRHEHACADDVLHFAAQRFDGRGDDLERSPRLLAHRLGVAAVGADAHAAADD